MAADKETPTKDQSAPPAPEVKEEIYDLAQLDQLITEQDPEFHQGLKEIHTEGGAQDLNIELLDLDRLLAEEEARSIKSRLKRLWTKIRNFLTGLKASLMHFLKNELPILAKKGAKKAAAGGAVVGEGLRQFGFKPLRFKLMVFGFIALCGGVGAYVWIALTRGVVHEGDELFLTTIETMSDQSWVYDPKEMEPFYDSVRAAQNIILIPKLVVNLKRSAGSGPTPMAACEFYVEGNSPDVVVEIKDREVEFRDLFMRTIEDFSYDQLESADGKQRLTERLIREANRVLTKGRVSRAFFKNVILKP